MASQVLFALAISFLAVGQISAAGKGTTNNIKEVFLGRCVNYEEIEYLDLMPRVPDDCATLWEDFSSVFAYKDDCDVSVEAYMPLISRIQQQVPPDMSMFWEGVYDLVHKYSDKGRRFVTIEDTITGYLGDSVTWCGQEEEPGMDHDQCPDYSDCSADAIESYWGAASVNFARAARGHVYVMLTGSNPELKAYRRDSYFGKYELPNMTDNVNKFTALLIHELGKPVLESCGDGSLLDLEADVNAKGFKYVCIDDPKDVVHILCSENPDADECQLQD